MHGSRIRVDHVGWRYEPQGQVSAQLNLPYCIATLLLKSNVFVDQFTKAAVADPDSIHISRLVDVKEDPAITVRGKAFRHAVRVEVALRDGIRMERTVEAPRGSEGSFASAETVMGEFRELAGRRMSAAQVERIVDAVPGAERLDDAGALPRLLAAGGDAGR